MQLGFTSLMAASSRGHIGVVRALLAAGADKDAKDKVCKAEIVAIIRTQWSPHREHDGGSSR